MVKPILNVASLIACLGLPFAVPCLADSDADKLFFDTVDVRVVNVEAVVLDADGQPVLGLEADDFTLFEDGEPVQITNFFAVEESRPVVDLEALDLPTTGDLEGPETDNLNLVMLVDNAHVAPKSRNQIFGNLKQLLRRLPPDDRIMIVGLGDSLKIEAPFTNDPTSLIEALERLERETGPQMRIQTTMRQILNNIQAAALPEAGGGTFGADSGARAQGSARSEAEGHASRIRAFAEERTAVAQGAIEAMSGFVDSLAGLKGRKALVYVGDGISTNPADALLQAWQDKYLDWLSRNGFSSSTLEGIGIGRGGGTLGRNFEKFLDLAAASQVAIYPISAGGEMARTLISAGSHGSFTTSGSGGNSRLSANLEQFGLEQSLLRMADETGGTAYTRSANIAGLLDQIRSDFTHFYSLGFRPQGEPTEARSLEIRVRNKDWTVRFGKTVREKSPLEHLQDRMLSALLYGVEDNPLNIVLTPTEQVSEVDARDDVYWLSVMVQIPFEKILLLPEEALHSGQLTLLVVVRDETTLGLSPFQQVEIPLQIPNDEILQVMTQSAAYPLELNIQEGPKRIAVGVRDRLAQVDSITLVEVKVGPQFSGIQRARNPTVAKP